MGFWDAFSWKKTDKEQVNNTKIARRSPTPIDWTDSMQVNSALTKGIYHNTYPGLKLGGVFGFNIISVPVSFMGLPIPQTENKTAQETLLAIIEQMRDEMKAIHIQSHREGTIWIFPKFSNGHLVWEFIPDDVVTDIIRDISSGEILRIETSEQLKLSKGAGKTFTVIRKRSFTRTKITVEYEGEIPSGLKGKVTRNPAHALPIPFSNNADGGRARGFSDYTRILSDIKNYHDMDLAESYILAKFSPKMILNKLTDIDKYSQNQGYSDAADMFTNIEIGKIDLILNEGEESVNFVTPERATESLRLKLQQIFHKLVQGSGIPELAWGLKMAGNEASAEEQMTSLMSYVQSKREQKNAAYTELFRVSLELLLTPAEKIEIEWNQLDAVSEKVRSEIFRNFAEGINSLITTAGMSKEQLFKFWKKNYPTVTAEEFNEWNTGITDMVGHVVSAKSTLDSLMLAQGIDITTGT